MKKTTKNKMGSFIVTMVMLILPQMSLATDVGVPSRLAAPVILYDEGGNILADADYHLSIVLRVVDGNILYAEEQDVSVRDGIANITVGDGFVAGSGFTVPTSGLSDDVFLSSPGDIAVEILVEGQNTPQEVAVLGSQPYAFVAQTALSLADDVVNSAKIVDASVTWGDLAESLRARFSDSSSAIVSSVPASPVTAEDVTVSSGIGLNNATGTNVHEVMQQLDAAIDTLREVRLDTLDASLETVGSDLGATQSDVTGLQGDLGTAQGDITTLQGSVAQTQNDLTSAQSSLTTDIATLNTSLAGTQANVSSAQGDISVLQSSAGTAQSNIVTLQSDLGTVQTNLSDLQSTVMTTQSDISVLQGDVGTLQSSVNTVQAEVDATETSISQLQTDLGSVQNSVNTVQSEVNTAETSISQLQTGLGATQSSVSTLQSGYSSLQNSLSSTQSSVSGLSSSVSGLQSTVSATQSDVSTNYLRRDGDNAMTDSFDLGGHNLVNVNLVDGVAVPQLESRVTTLEQEVMPDNITDLGYTVIQTGTATFCGIQSVVLEQVGSFSPGNPNINAQINSQYVASFRIRDTFSSSVNTSFSFTHSFGYSFVNSPSAQPMSTTMQINTTYTGPGGNCSNVLIDYIVYKLATPAI